MARSRLIKLTFSPRPVMHTTLSRFLLPLCNNYTFDCVTNPCYDIEDFVFKKKELSIGDIIIIKNTKYFFVYTRENLSIDYLII